jgi:hypothetical protein
MGRRLQGKRDMQAGMEPPPLLIKSAAPDTQGAQKLQQECET